MLIRKDVEIIEIQDMPVIYLEHIGPYKEDSELFARLFGKLFKWAGERKLINFPETKMLTVYHDDPDAIDEQQQRISICMTTKEAVDVEGEIGAMKIEGGKYAVGHFEVSADEYGEAWMHMYEKWLPKSDLKLDERPCFELYVNDPETHPEKKHWVDIYVSVKEI